MKKSFKITLGLLSVLMILTGCNRFLNEKSDSTLAVPVSLEDNQALMDRLSDVMINFASSGLASCDELYLSDADFDAMEYQEDKRLYTWQKDHVSASQAAGNDWYYTYKGIYISNVVLNNLDTYAIPGAENVRGQALTMRAIRYLDAVQIWCPAYSSDKASTDLGLPLRLDPDMNIPSERSTMLDLFFVALHQKKTIPNDLPLEFQSFCRILVASLRLSYCFSCRKSQYLFPQPMQKQFFLLFV